MSETEHLDEVPRGKTFQVTARMVRRCMPGEGRGFILGLILLLAASGATLLQPWPIKIVIDSVIGNLTPPAILQWFTSTFQNSDTAGHPGIALLTLLCLGLLLIELV